MNAQQLKDLLDRYQQGIATPKERLMVDAYFATADNSSADFSSNKNRIQVQNRIWGRLQQAVQPAVVKQLNIRKKLIQVAAACFIICLTTGLAYQFRYNILDAVDPIAMKTVTTDAFETKQVLLPDSSLVTLAQNSRVSFKERYREGKRLVELDGVAFFNVTRDSLRPFTVKGHAFEVEVLGTSFEVNDKEGQDEAQVSVLTGKVQVTGDNQQYAILTPGKTVRYNRLSQQMQVTLLGIDSIAAWRNNRYVFNETPLDDVLQTLRRHSHVDIQVDEAIQTSKYSFAGSFGRDESVREMLEVICFSAGLHYTMPDTSRIIISK